MRLRDRGLEPLADGPSGRVCRRVSACRRDEPHDRRGAAPAQARRLQPQRAGNRAGHGCRLANDVGQVAPPRMKCCVSVTCGRCVVVETETVGRRQERGVHAQQRLQQRRQAAGSRRRPRANPGETPRRAETGQTPLPDTARGAEHIRPYVIYEQARSTEVNTMQRQARLTVEYGGDGEQLRRPCPSRARFGARQARRELIMPSPQGPAGGLGRSPILAMPRSPILAMPRSPI